MESVQHFKVNMKSLLFFKKKKKKKLCKNFKFLMQYFHLAFSNMAMSCL